MRSWLRREEVEPTATDDEQRQSEEQALPITCFVAQMS